MSWQRIDENTYIDDTLVTCAEYQLFIDEMREQGKYYQPNHWTSYQFPKGKAREPVLGVRRSDVVEFCEWLTRLQDSEWSYRLPVEGEENYIAINKLSKENSLGYWILSAEKEYQFFWIEKVMPNPRGIDTVLTRRFIDQARAQGLDLNIELTLALDRASDRPLDNDINNYREPDFDDNPARHYSVEYIFSRDLARLLMTSNYSGDNVARALEIYLDLARDSIRDYAIQSALKWSAFNGNNNPVFNETYIKNHKLKLYRSMVITFDLYVDICTLQERIDGRSPAFEGIRLVKERIR